MKIINNSAVEFFSTFCPSFYEKKNKKKKKKHARRLNVVAVFLSVEGMSGAGGGYERWMAPLVRGVWGGPKKIV